MPIRPDTKYSVGLLVVAVGVIAIGVTIRPAEKRETPISELETATLRRLTQQRRLSELGEYIAYSAQNAAKALVYVPELHRTATIVRSDGTLITSTSTSEQLGPLTAVSAAAPRFQLGNVLSQPQLPFLLLSTGQGWSWEPPAVFQPEAGDWILVVALRPDATPVFSYGLFESATETRCGAFSYRKLRASIPLTNAFIGGGLFSMTGALAGVVVPCGDEIAVLSRDSLLAAAKKPLPPVDKVQYKYGLRVTEASDTGLAVVAVWDGTDTAGVRPGDRILAVDDVSVQSAEDLDRLLEAPQSHTLRIQRGKRTWNAELPASDGNRKLEYQALGLSLRDCADGVLVESVSRGASAEAAGIVVGDTVRTVDQKLVSSAAEAAILLDRSRKPVLVSLQRNGRKFEALITP